jgi:hypothetical protein
MWRDGSGAGDVAHVIKHVLYTPEPSAKVKSPPSLLIFGWTRLFFFGPAQTYPELARDYDWLWYFIFWG